MRKAVALLMCIIGLAACGGAEEAPAPLPTPNTTLMLGRAIVDTVGKTDCNTDKEPGDCYLPLYELPSFSSQVLNQIESPESRCRRPEDSGRPDSQSSCWPQPGTELKVVCKRVVDGEEWTGVRVPVDEVLRMPNMAQPVPGGDPGDVIGFNKSTFILPLRVGPLVNCV